jgi:DNA-binding winged helix-turn-helix (wHTH) protein
MARIVVVEDEAELAGAIAARLRSVSRRRVRRDGQLVGLTATEFDLLTFLLSAPG